MSQRKKALGRGLDALFTDYTENGIVEGSSLSMLDINHIDPKKDQARKTFDETALNELAESIKLYGIIEPIVVEQSGERYTIIAGERRYRAARLAELTEVPAIIRSGKSAEENEIVALIENLQRVDLNPLEQSAGIHDLMEHYNYTQEQAADVLGISRPQVANLLRLLKLPTEVQAYVREGKLSLGHAKLLAGIKDEEKLLTAARYIIQHDLNMRASEAYIKSLVEVKAPVKEIKPAWLSILENRAEQNTGTKVDIKYGKKIGHVDIEFYNNDDLDRIINLLTGGTNDEQ